MIFEKSLRKRLLMHRKNDFFDHPEFCLSVAVSEEIWFINKKDQQ